jgi:hypothetical protein
VCTVSGLSGLIQGSFIFPSAAPSTEAFAGNSPKGRRMDAASWQRDRKSLLPTPSKSFGAQEISGGRVAFSLVTFFGHAKESNSPVGARTDIKIASQGESFFIDN